MSISCIRSIDCGSHGATGGSLAGNLTTSTASTARMLLGQIVVVAETIAGRLESSNPEEVTQGLHSIKATLRQKIREASQRIDVDKLGQVVAEKMMSKYGSEKSLAIIATLTSLLSDTGLRLLLGLLGLLRALLR